MVDTCISRVDSSALILRPVVLWSFSHTTEQDVSLKPCALLYRNPRSRLFPLSSPHPDNSHQPIDILHRVARMQADPYPLRPFRHSGRYDSTHDKAVLLAVCGKLLGVGSKEREDGRLWGRKRD
jgi:hypothetical protein